MGAAQPEKGRESAREHCVDNAIMKVHVINPPVQSLCSHPGCMGSALRTVG
jgi:hypothetical protein